MVGTANITVSVSLAIILNSAERKKRKLQKNQIRAYVLLQRPFCIGYWAFPIPVNYFMNGYTECLHGTSDVPEYDK